VSRVFTSFRYPRDNSDVPTALTLLGKDRDEYDRSGGRSPAGDPDSI
jgi:hypothetical protein